MVFKIFIHTKSNKISFALFLPECIHDIVLAEVQSHPHVQIFIAGLHQQEPAGTKS